MSYSYSSTYPRVPNSTPQHPASTRPPIHNPYDKFTQPQFDEWIGGITSALRRALGQEEDDTRTSQPTISHEEVNQASDTDEDVVEDSFAEWRAIRTKEKGKMRAIEDEEADGGDSYQESYEGSGVRDYTNGNSPDDAIELLSDDDDAGGGELNSHAEYDVGGHDCNFDSVASGGQADRPYIGGSQPAPSRPHHAFTDKIEREAIEISDGETGSPDRADDSFEMENVLFGWGQDEQGEFQQPPDIRDPWELPKVYAEDLYSGGPIRGTDRSKLSPSRLTPPIGGEGHLDNIDSRLRPSPVLVSKSADHTLAGVPQGTATPVPIPPTTFRVSDNGDEASLYEDALEMDTPTAAQLRDESEFISFTALNQPSDAESEGGEPEILYISDNDGEGVSEGDGEAEDDLDDGPIPLGTSDLEIPTEGVPEEDEEELDELEDDDEPLVAGNSANHLYGYYGLDASSITGSGGLEDETKAAGPPSDAPKSDRNQASNVAFPQESASLLDPHDLAPLPTAATLIDTDHQLHSAISAVIDGTTKVSLAEVSLTSLVGTSTTLAEVVVGIEDGDEDSAGNDTILADEAILAADEVEYVLRDAFAKTDRMAPTANVLEGTTPIPRTPPFIEQTIFATLNQGSQDTPSEAFAEGLPIDEPPTKDEGDLVVRLPSAAQDEPSRAQETQKDTLPFIMPLIANPNVRDPMSAPWSPVQSGPSTPITGLAHLPAVTKFKRDNQLLGTTHGSSGLFTPLEGSGSSSPSPSDTATPEDRPTAEGETEELAIDDGNQYLGVQVASAVPSPTSTSLEIQGAETEVIPTDPPGDDGWEGIPRLPTPPAEAVGHVEVPTAVPMTRVFFQPVESHENVGSPDAQRVTVDDETWDDGPLPVAADQCLDVQGQNDPEKPVHPTGDTTKDLPVEADKTSGLVGNNSSVAIQVVTNNGDAVTFDEERTPSLDTLEVPVSVAKGPSVAEPTHEDTQPSSPLLTRPGESSDIPAKAQKVLRKRKRSVSIPIDLEPPESYCATNGKPSDTAATSPTSGEREAVANESADKEPRSKEEYDSDNESFASSLVAPRNADPLSQDGSRASSVVSEQLIPLGSTPVPEDAPVFHGHGKFKATFQALKLGRQASENLVQESEHGTAKERTQERECTIITKPVSRKPSENNSKEAKLPPSLVLPEVSVLRSLPSTSTSQSPVTPTSAPLPSSPTIVTVPAQVAVQIARGSTEPYQEQLKKPIVKVVKRATPKKRAIFEPKSTRSQCRYHKISLPREENGPRLTFCVPQCSLNDKELMEEENITDDGLATVRDFERLWDHVEEQQQLDPYLIGVLRQLVGVDLLRENEVYYLPKDDEIKKMERRQKREERRKSRKSIGSVPVVEGIITTGNSSLVSATGSTPQPSSSQVEKGKSGPPPSLAESVSTTNSARSKGDKGGSARSMSDDEVTDGERGGRALKRRKRLGKERDSDARLLRNTPSAREDSVASSTTGSPAPSHSTTEHTPARRSQRASKKAISMDAQAYKPTVSSDDSGEDEPESAKTRKRATRTTVKSLKRRRTEGTTNSSTPSSANVGTRDQDVSLSPRSTRVKRVKLDEK